MRIKKKKRPLQEVIDEGMKYHDDLMNSIDPGWKEKSGASSKRNLHRMTIIAEEVLYPFLFKAWFQKMIMRLTYDEMEKNGLKWPHDNFIRAIKALKKNLRSFTIKDI